MEASHPSLARLIASGDRDAVAGYHDSRIHKVRTYCATVCPAELVDQACEASFIDFEGRVRSASDSEESLDDLLLKATRAAAAPRLELKRAGRRSDGAECAAVAVLLAAERNRELPRGGDALHRHLEHCETCKLTVSRLAEAERAFAEAEGWEES